MARVSGYQTYLNKLNRIPSNPTIEIELKQKQVVALHFVPDFTHRLSSNFKEYQLNSIIQKQQQPLKPC